MKSESPSYVRHPKLSRYFRSDQTAVRRLRSLLEFVDSGSVLDARLFFLDCHSSVFKCVSDAIAQIEAEAAAGSGDAGGDDVASLLSDSQCVLDVLGALMTQSPHLIKGKWQLRPIHHILQQALSHYSHIALRRHALSVLMLLIGVLGSAEEPSLLALLSSAVDLTLFLPASALQSTFCHYLHSSPCHRQPTLFAWSLPAPRPAWAVRQAGECELLRALLNGTLLESQQTSCTQPFPFWLRIVQTHLLPLLYRGLFTPADSSLLPLGFSPLPPASLHACVVEWLLRAALLDNSSSLLPTAASLDSLLSLLRLTFNLPPSASACQMQVLALYEQWLRGEQLPALLHGKTDELARVVVDHTAALLTRNGQFDAEGDETEEDELSAGRLSYEERERARSMTEQMELAHVHTCDRILSVWSSLCEQRECRVSASTCDYVLHSLLRVCDELLHRALPPSAVLLRSLLSCLLTCFLSTPADVAPTLWQQLQAMLRSWLIKHPEVLDSWASVMRQWTDRLLFTLAVEGARQRPSHGSRHQQQQFSSAVAARSNVGSVIAYAHSSAPYTHPTAPQPATAPLHAATDIAQSRATVRSTESWTAALSFECIFGRWLLLLRLPGPPLSASSMRVRQSALLGLQSSLATLLSSLQRPRTVTAPDLLDTSAAVTLVVPRHQLPSSNTLLLLFGGWLLDCCLHTLNNAVPSIGHLRQPRLSPLLPAPLCAYSFDPHSDQSSPFASACLLLTTRSAAPLDDRWLSSLYHIVRLALSSNQTDILYTVVRSCTSLFTGELDGVHVLIADFMRVIKRLLGQAAVAGPTARTTNGSSAPSHSVFSYTTPSTPLHDSMGHTPLQKRDRTRISLLSEEGEALLAGEDEGEEEEAEQQQQQQQWLKQHSNRSSTDFSRQTSQTATGHAAQASTLSSGQQHTLLSHIQRDQSHGTSVSVDEEYDSEDHPAVSVRLACLSILHSWIALPFLFGDSLISQLFPLHAESSPLHGEALRVLSATASSSPQPTPPSSAVSYWSLRSQLPPIILRSLRHDASPAVQSACLWALHLWLQLELDDAGRSTRSPTANSDSGQLVCRCLAAILTCCRPVLSAAVSHTAIEVLRTSVELLSASPTMRWSQGYNQLRHSLGQPSVGQKDTAEAGEDDEADGDSNKRDSDEEGQQEHSDPTLPVHTLAYGTPPQHSTSAQHHSTGSNGGSVAGRSRGTERASGGKEMRPLLLPVMLESLCVIATQHLQALVTALNDCYQPLQPLAPSTPAVSSHSAHPSSDDRFALLAQVLSSLFLTLLDYIMSFPSLLSPSSPLWSTSSCVRVRRCLFALLQSALSLRAEQSVSLRDRSRTAAAGQRASSFSPSFAAPPALGAHSVRSRVTAAELSGSSGRDLSRGTSSPPITPPRKPQFVQFDVGGQSAQLANQLPATFLRACDAVEEGAAALLRHLITRMHNFPTPLALGPEQVDSAVSEEDDQGEEEPSEDSRLHVVLDESTVVTVYHLNGDHSGDTARLVVRDMTGKYAWDVQLLREADSQLAQRVRQQRSERAALAEWAHMQLSIQHPKRTAPIRQWGAAASEGGQQGDSSGEEELDDSARLTQSGATHQSIEGYDSEQHEDEDEGEDESDDNEAQADIDEQSASQQQVDASRDHEADGDEYGEEERRTEAAGEAESLEESNPPLADKERTARGLDAALGDGVNSVRATVLGAPRIDSEGNSSTLYVSWTDVHIVESFHASPDSTSPRNRRQTSAAAATGRDETRDENRKGGRSGGSHLKHFLQVRKRRHELQQQAMDRPRSLSQVAAAPILPPSPSFHAVGSIDTATPLLTVISANTSSTAASISSPLSLPSLFLSLSLSPALSAYPALRSFASDLFFPSTSGCVSSVSEPASSVPSFLPDNLKVRRALRLLDRVAVRETFKVGVLYCSRGQDSQQAVLSNGAGSAAYEQFVRGLGWEVSLSSHRGFTGGLESGERSVYFSNSTCEVMWHVATRMLSSHGSTDPASDDRSMLRKKRHIGNDYVHVVWSEHWLDYAADTLSSHFNHVHIVVYPIHCHQQQQAPLACRVQLFSKPSVPLFGPLQSHMIVPLHSLPALVRLTAINANRAIRHSTPEYQPPYPTRRALLNELISKAAMGGRDLQAFTAAVTQQHKDGSDYDNYT